MDYYKLLAIISPLASVFLAGLFAYVFSLRAKKFDILYENKIPAFKEITFKLTNLKKFCDGRVAYFIASEYSPYYESNVGILQHRIEIANTVDINSIFISPKSRKSIDNLLSEMGSLANAEQSIISGNDMIGIEDEYERINLLTENCIAVLYKDLNLK